MMKRVISLLLAAVLLVGAVPVGAFATETEAAVSDNGMTIEGGNAVGNLLAQEIQAEMSEEEVYEPGFSVTGLEFSGATATVTYDAMEKASLVVAIYSEDGLTLLNNAYTTVYPDATQATVTISGEMPEYFYAAAYLVDTYDMSPLCPDYSTPMYTRDMQDLLDSTVADYDADRVLNLDGSNETNFMVYSERTVLVEEQSGVNTIISADDTAMTYVIGNADETFTGLLEGDVVAYPYGDDQFLFVKVASIDVEGSTVTIQGMDYELEDVFSHVKIEGTGDTEDLIVDESTCTDGVTYEGLVEDGSARSTYDLGGSLNTRLRRAFGLNLKAETDGKEVSVSGRVNLGIDTAFDFYVSQETQFVEFRVDIDLKTSLVVSGTLKKEIDLPKLAIPVFAGVTIGFSPKFIVQVTGEVSVGLHTVATTGFNFQNGKGFTLLQSSGKNEVELEASVTVFIGFDLCPDISALNDLVLEFEGHIPFGREFAYIAPLEEKEEEAPQVRHDCEKCFAFDVSNVISAGLEIKFLKCKGLTFDCTIREYRKKLEPIYYSVDHSELGKGECPYQSFRVSIEVLDYYGQPVSGALVTATGEISRSETTNANGIASIYLPLCQYNIRAEIDNLRRTVSTGVLQPRTLTITLPEPPDDPEETVPDEVIPEVTEPAFPGGILGDIESTPVVNLGKAKYSGDFGDGSDLRWAFYPNANYHEYGYGGTLKITGNGSFTTAPWKEFTWIDEYNQVWTTDLERSITEVVMDEGITGCGDVFGRQKHRQVKSVSIPSTMKNIDDYAFCYSNIETLILPRGVTSIGEYAFSWCWSLTKVVLPDTLESIGAFAFDGCYDLEEITIPGSLKSMGNRAFLRCGLKKVVVEEGVTELGFEAFGSCEDLVSVSLPDGLKNTGSATFMGCKSLRSIKLPDSIEPYGLGGQLFAGTALESIVIPENVQVVSAYTFQNCTSLTSVTFNNRMHYIGQGAFEGCTALESITIPNNVTTFISDAFNGCTNLKEINFEAFNETYGDNSSRRIYLQDHVFANCTSLTQVNLPSLNPIQPDVFAGCTNLESIVISGPIWEFDPHYGYSEETGEEAFAGLTATIYYPAFLYENEGYGEAAYTKERMAQLGSQITWIPYTVDEAGNMIPDESKAYCANPAAEEEIIDQEPANGLLPTQPVETEPVETEPLETEPVETEPVETEPVETEPVETEPVETEPVETEPVETAPIETEPVETVAQTEPAETEPQFLTLEEAAELKIPTSASAVMPESKVVETVPAAQYEAEVLPPEELMEYLLPPKYDPPPAPPEWALNREQVIGNPSYNAIFGGDYSSEEREEYILKTASFSGLVPGEEYLLLAVKSLSGDPMSMSNLIHIDQGRASSGGTLEFDYVEREEFAVSYVMACGASNKNLNDAVITVPTMYASEGEQIVKPKVKYGGKTLKQGTDYTLTGDVAFNTAGEHVCYIRGIYEYTGLVKCTYTVLEKPLPRIMIEGVDAMEGGTTATLTAEFTFDPDPDTVVTWSLAEGDEAYATLTPNGNSVTVKASQVEETTYITLRAEAPGKAEPAEHELTIFPRYTSDILTEKIEIWQTVQEEDGEVWYLVSDDYEPTIWVDGETESSIVLNIDTYPMGADRYVYWESSDPEVAVLEQEYGQNNTLTFTGKPGDVTIYACATDGSEVVASATYHAKLPMAVEPAVDSDIHLLAGKSTTLKIRNAETKKDIKSGNIQWTLDAGENDATAYATINKSGKLTANKIGEKANLTVYGHVYDKGEYVTSVPFTVTIYPAVTQVEIQKDEESVNGQTLHCDPDNQGTLTLKVKAYPDDVRSLPVKWSISDQKKQQYASYETQFDKETGENTLIITPKDDIAKIGTVTIKATTDEGSKKSASMKVQFGIFADQVNISAEGGKTSLTSREKLNLSATVTPDDVTKSGVTWSLSKEDKAYASLSAKGTNAVLTAKTVYTQQEVTVVATSKDGAARAEYKVTILPENILVIRDAAEKNVTKTTISVDLNRPEEERTLTLSAGNFLDEETVAVKWKPAKSSAAAEVVHNADGTISVTMLKKGSLTVTAEAQDGSKRKATVTIKAANLAQAVSITTKDGKNVVVGEDKIPVISLASGKSVNLKAEVQNASSSKVNWRVVMLDGEGRELDAGRYAKITSSGKLSATKDLTSMQEVWVYALPADGGSAEGKAKVVIRPLAQGVQIYTEDQASGQMRTLADSRDAGIFGIARATTTMEWDMQPETNKTLQLSAKVYPYYEGADSRSALQTVSWISSKPKVASIDAGGKITFHQAGTTTITVTAADGSNKKVSFKLEVVKVMTSLKLPQTAFIAGGKKLTLVPEITPVDTTWPYLAWHVSDSTGRNDVSISSKGVLTTPKVTTPREVFVQAMSCDGSDLWTYCDVTIYPATTKIQLWNGETEVSKLTLAPGETVSLKATCEPELAAGVYQWTSSNESYATVDQNGKVVISDTAVSGKKVTITCMAEDGTKVKAKVTITIGE